MKQEMSLAAALTGVETGRKLPKEVVEEALKEAMQKAYRKQINILDAYVRVEIVNGEIEIYHERIVVEEVYDDELEISLEDARKLNPNAQIDDMIGEKVDFSGFDRAAVVLAKNVMKQKIREAEKQLVYEEYCDKIDEMVLGTIETVEEKFIIVNIGKTLAMMKRSQAMPNETYKEGQKILVIIKEVNKDTKGAQVLVSRGTSVLVRRLFEKEVPEIYNGTIEIKAIARDPGERCKIAVYSHNENIDPIGACIGPRGARVQAIINELHGEKIDIFEWSDNVTDLISNALSPSEAVAVVPNDRVKDGLIVVVPDNQLSLAIGKRGKNARLAVKLTNQKIDIKSESEMKEAGIDYMSISAQMQKEYEEKKAKERAYKQQQKIDELKVAKEDTMDVIDEIDFTYDEPDVLDESDFHDEDTLFALEQEQKMNEMEEAARIAKELRKEKASIGNKEYVSKFEEFADASNKNEVEPAPKKKQEEKEEIVIKKPKFEQIQPIYTEEELLEMEEEYDDEDEENKWDEDIDYEQYDEYYD